MKVYLAGKIAKNDWRHDIVRTQQYGTWALKMAWPHPASSDSHERWPVLRDAVFGHDYVGPYFIGDDHGCGHGGGTHGVGDLNTSCFDAPSRSDVVQRCLHAIEAADLVFAWIDDLTAHGTLVEIGWAAARGKKVVIGTTTAPGRRVAGETISGHFVGEFDPSPLSDMWFVFHMGQVIEAPTPREAIESALKPEPSFDSPLEESFWAELKRRPRPALAGLVPQHPVDRYRIDFALPDRKIGVELDGFTYHGSKDAFNADRARQRNLELAGWRIIRFTGDEVRSNVAHCVDLAAKFAA